MPSPYDVRGFYGPGGDLNMEAQIGGQDVLGSAPGPDFGALGNLLGGHMQNSLALKQQQALQAMDLERRKMALAEAGFGADLAADRRDFRQARSDRRFAQAEQRDAQARAETQRLQAQREALMGERRASEREFAPTYGQYIQTGPGTTGGMIPVNGPGPGAFMTGRVRRQDRVEAVNPWKFLPETYGAGKVNNLEDVDGAIFREQKREIANSGPSTAERTRMARGR